MKNLREHLAALAHESPAQPALLVCDTRGNITEEISRAALLEKVEQAAAYLQSLGLSKGDRVALELGNCADLLILSWAAWSVGVVTVPLDTKRDTAELRSFKLRTSGAKQVVQEESRSKIYSHLGVPPQKVEWMPDFSHEALILFTSGTTAYPKGACLTLRNLIVNAEGIIEWLKIGANDRFLVELPLHHINSTTFCLAALIAEAGIAIPPTYSNSHFFEQAASSRATFTSLVPSIIFDQLSRQREFKAVKDRLKLNRIQIGSAPVVAAATLEFIHTFHIPLYQGYGQTETALRVTGVPMDMGEEEYEERVAENSIGTPMSWAEVEIADAEGHILVEGQQGELIVKGPAVMQGYVDGEPAFRDGFFLTGDIGYWKEIGGRRFFSLIGRSKEIIIKGGINISPIAVENALKKISDDIEQAYVIGIPNERYGEEVGAVIVWKAGIDKDSSLRRLKIRLFSGSEMLSEYETPKYLVDTEVQSLPITSTGKVQRIQLKESIHPSKFESIYNIGKTDDYRFVFVDTQSPYSEASRALYNHCWQPLTQTQEEYKQYLRKNLTLIAVNKDNSIAGQISFTRDKQAVTCVSICSAGFVPKPVPEIILKPSLEEVRRYVLGGHDPVMNFHKKLGAVLEEVILDGRPEDKSSCGYTMLLSYPSLEHPVFVGPASHQLIAVVRQIAANLHTKVFALSRPGGLAAYIRKSGVL